MVDRDLRKQWSLGVGSDEDVRMEHRYLGPSLKDALQCQSVCISHVIAYKCPLCYILGYVQIA